MKRAHEEVAQAAADNTAHANMGSTVVAIRIEDRHAEIAWVGDSRAYLWRSDTLRQLSRDHSYLEVLREQENLTETQLRGHPNKNLVTQTLGIGTPEPSSITEPLRRGDWLLLCSDGLNDELEDSEIAKILRTHNAPDAAADALIAAALAHGGRDNVSAVLVEYDGPNGVSFEPENDTVARGSRRRLHGDPPGDSLVVVLRTLTTARYIWPTINPSSSKSPISARLPSSRRWFSAGRRSAICS